MCHRSFEKKKKDVKKLLDVLRQIDEIGSKNDEEIDPEFALRDELIPAYSLESKKGNPAYFPAYPSKNEDAKPVYQLKNDYVKSIYSLKNADVKPAYAAKNENAKPAYQFKHGDVKPVYPLKNGNVKPVYPLKNEGLKPVYPIQQNERALCNNKASKQKTEVDKYQFDNDEDAIVREILNDAVAREMDQNMDVDQRMERDAEDFQHLIPMGYYLESEEKNQKTRR